MSTDYSQHLASLPLLEALWWFIENATEEDEHRTSYFFALRERYRNEQVSPRVVITIEGGLVQDVSANVPGIEFVKVDYDTEGADADDYTQVAQLKPDGSITGYADAFISSGSASVDKALIDKRFEEAQAYEEREP